MITTFTLLPSRSPRQEIVDEIRENFSFLHENGPKNAYSFQKIAEMINGLVETRLDKGDARRFLLGEYKLSNAPLPLLGKLLDFSRKERLEMEGELSGIFNRIVVSIPVTVSLVEAFENNEGLFQEALPEVSEKLRQMIDQPSPD